MMIETIPVESILLSGAGDKTSLSFIHIHVRGNHDFLRKHDIQTGIRG